MEALLLLILLFGVIGCFFWWLDESETGTKWLDKLADWMWR